MYFIRRKKIDPEEYEQHMVQRETERESQLDFHIVERVIGKENNKETGDVEYLVKCKRHSVELPLFRLPNCIQGKV
jgi:chromodomain-helicase-DNA-binding protein 1